jgi:hypothetical protein
VYTAYVGVAEQCSIGWDHAICGCVLSKMWGEANAQYVKVHFHQRELTANELWSTRLVSLLWQYGIDRWIDRNEFIYGKTKAPVHLNAFSSGQQQRLIA